MSLNELLRGSKLRLVDLILIALGVLGSFSLRLNIEQLFLDYVPALSFMLILALIVKPFIYTRFGLYQRLWAYASVAEMRLIVRAVTIASSIVAIFVLSAHSFGLFARLPRSVVVIDWLASLALVGGLRFAFRLFNENVQSPGEQKMEQTRRALIVGAGSAGALVVREIRKNPKAGIVPLAFLDDDPDKLGKKVHDIEVLGAVDQLPKILKSRNVDEVIFAIPSASGKVLRKVSEICQQENIAFRTMPGIYELIGGTVSVNRLREVDITDLLRREPAKIDRKRVGDSIRNKIVLITGAGGSIASELCRQVARWQPKELVLIGHGENSIFEILLEISSDFPKLAVRPYIADIRDRKRLSRIIYKHKPNILFHAAAHKHVPLMEINISEAVTNNIF
jgi:FlaA1/EpsC-like NDP-sugar epimerase